MTWLVERGRPAEAADIAWRLLFFWLIQGRAAEGLRWYELALSVPGLPPPAQATAHLGSAVMSYTQGDPERARGALARALPLARGANEIGVAVQAEHLLGHVEQAAGNIGAAGELFARSLDGFRTLEMPWGSGNALIGLAGVALAKGDPARAEQLLDEATAVLRDAGPWFLNLPLYIRAILAVGRGHPDAAIAFVRESLVCSRQLQDRFAFVFALIPLAAAAALKGDDAWAARILGARDAVTERTGSTVSDRSVRDLRDRAERQARASLGEERWTHAYAAGRHASVDSLLYDIDKVRT
jgi:tetratricopeptide (TPR) repeat protein